MCRLILNRYNQDELRRQFVDRVAPVERCVAVLEENGSKRDRNGGGRCHSITDSTKNVAAVSADAEE